METSEKKGKKWERTNVTNLLRNRESGNYYARVKVGSKQKWRSLNTDVATVAKQRLPAAVEELRAQVFTAAGQTLAVEDSAENRFLMARFIVFYTSSVENNRRLKPPSKSRALDTVKTLVRSWPDLPNRDVRRLTVADCNKWANDALRSFERPAAPNAKTIRKGMAASSFNKCLDALRGIMEQAKKEGVIYRNPATEVVREKPEKKMLNLPNSEKFQEILSQMERSPSRWATDATDLARLLAYSGARLREGTAMRWNHVDFAKGLVIVPGTKSDGSKDRPVPLFPSLREFLEKLRTSRGPESPDTRIVRVQTCSHTLKRACVKVGIAPLDHHDLRHLFVTRCIESGVPVPTIADWVGHADGGITLLKTYKHLLQEHSLAQGARVKF
ncbi:MAG: site-specific integrase [Verrucomicrobia bacterium]|nr:site-specific integrase [Verrucomicrobiota bacterium]